MCLPEPSSDRIERWHTTLFPSTALADHAEDLSVVESHAQRILKRLNDYLGYSPPPLLERIVADAQKIH